MPRIINFGSLNIDYVYAVTHFVRGGETLAASDRAIHAGGKGLNQSVALARAGLRVAHAGAIGPDGVFLKELLAAEGVDVSRIALDATRPTGHTVIQVTPEGENAILYYAGMNAALSADFARETIEALEPEDVVLLQNETSAVADIIEAALEKGLRVVFNPAPYDPSVNALPLEKLHALFLNMTEACGILGMDPVSACASPEAGEKILAELAERFPQTTVVLTQGSRGAGWSRPGEAPGFAPAFPVKAVDTTGAGDTFTGYAVRAILAAESAADPQEAARRFAIGMRTASMAAALSVTKPGAAGAIPALADVLAALGQ